MDAEQAAEVSLAGLSASLLLMDTVQGRLDTHGALYRPGNRADSQVPSPPAAPELFPYPAPTPIGEAERQRIAAALMSATRDEWHAEGVDGEAEAQAYALNEHEALVVIRSGCAAYNCDFALYRVSRHAPYRQRELQIEPLPLGYSGLTGGVSYDEETGTLSYLMKGRGIGDCGDSGNWLFDGERFQLQFLRVMGRCADIAPEAWPVLWRSGHSVQMKLPRSPGLHLGYRQARQGKPHASLTACSM